MITPEEIQLIKDFTKDFLDKMGVTDASIEASVSFVEGEKEAKDAVEVTITLGEPQILIGQEGTTLFELQRILRLALNKKLKKLFYINLDINDYKKKKIEHLKSLAESLASEVLLTKIEKVLPSMTASERRIIHMQLANREDVTTES